MRRTVRMVLAAIVLVAACRATAADDMVARLADLLKSRFPGENFIPVPSGSEARWAPKSIWCYQDVKKKSGGAGTTKAWVRFSSGQLLYPDAMAPLQKERVTVGKRDDKVQGKLALAASLAGVLSGVQASADVVAELEKNVTFTVEIPAAEIHWVDLEDLRMSRDLAPKEAIEKFNSRRKAGGELPATVVVNAALWVSGGRVKASVEKKAGVKIEGELAGVLKSLGLDVEKVQKTGDEVEYASGGYIAVSALEMSTDGLISKSDADGGFKLTAENVSTPSEDRHRPVGVK